MKIDNTRFMMNLKKKGYTLLLSVILLFNLIGTFPAKAETNNETALFAAVRWAPVGQAWSGSQLIDDTDYNFGDTSKVTWGRGIFRMPDAQLAVSGGYNVKATETTSTTPVYWCILYSFYTIPLTLIFMRTYYGTNY